MSRLCHALVLLTASHRRSFFLLILLSISFAAYYHVEFPHGGSWIGLTYGTIGVVLICILMYYGVRKRSYRSRLGALEIWLSSHMSLGVLALVSIVFHSGLRFQDQVAVTALVLMILVFVSGVVGAVLYKLVPPRMLNVESSLSAAEISEKINGLSSSMRRLATGKSLPFQGLCASLIREQSPGSFAGWRVLTPGYRRTRSMRDPGKLFAADIARIAAQEQSELAGLLDLSRQMNELHERLIRRQSNINLMSVWMYIHLPLSILMSFFIVVHIIAALFYF